MVESHFMVDLETFGTGPQAAVAAIGIVSFHPSTGVGRGFYCTVDVVADQRAGGQIDGDTVLWWLKQDEEARAVLTSDARNPHMALVDAVEFMRRMGDADIRIWGNGATFDNVILRNMFQRHDIPAPWHYSGDRCFRTLKNLRPDITHEFDGTKHNALQDARNQALHACKILNALQTQEVTSVA